MKRACAVAFCVIVLATTSIYAQPVTGVHFDVEPASLPGGAMGNAAPFISLMQKLKAVTNGVTKLNADIPMGMAQAWTYNGRPIAQYIADVVDVVTVMAYRDHAAPSNGIIDISQTFLNYAKKIGKKVVVGVETNCNLGDIVSFCEEGATYMEGQLGSVVGTLSSYGATYDGLAVHDYTGYSSLAGSMKLPSSAPCRALWVWTHSVVTDTNARAKFIDFCQRMRVCTVYMESQGLVDSSSQQPKLKAFVMALYDVGIQTELLFGNAEWTYTANHGQAIALAQASVNFIKSLPSGGGGGGMGTTGRPSVGTTGSASNTGTPSSGGACGQKVVTKRYRVSDGNDDVEEQDNNYIYCTSSDLEMVMDGKIHQIVGMRFKNVDISAQDKIMNAYLEMQAKSTQSKTTNLVIHGEKVENSGVLCDQSRPLSQRALTNAQTDWPNIPKFDAGGIYQTPNIAPVVSEIVQQGGWSAGNAMSFIVSGSGLRHMKSYNGGGAPYLVVQVQTVLCGQDYGNNDTDTTTDWWAEGATPTADDSRDYNSATQVSVLGSLFLFCISSLLLL